MKPLTRCLLVLVAALGLGSLTPETSAQSTTFEVTPMIGYQFGGEVDLDATILDTNRLDVAESETLGLVLDATVHQNVQIELRLNHQETSFEQRSGLFQPDIFSFDADLSYALIGANFQWSTNGQVVPFVGVGFGLAEIDPVRSDLETETNFASSVGGGVKIFINDHFGVRFEGRGYWIDIGKCESDRRGGCSRNGDDRNGLVQAEASFGLIFAW